MKKLLLILLIAIAVSSCKSGAEKALDRVFQPAWASDGGISTKQITSANSICNSTACINSDSTFTYEFGCQGRSNITIGTWKRAGDSLLFTPTPKSRLEIAFYYSVSGNNSKDSTTFIILDKARHPIHSFIIRPFDKRPTYAIHDGEIEVSDINEVNKVDSNYTTNGLGILKICKSKFDSLDFPKLDALAGKQYHLKNKNLPDTVRLIINVNGLALENYRLTYSDSAIPKLPYRNLKP